MVVIGNIQKFDVENCQDPISKFRHIARSEKTPFLQLRLEVDVDSPKVINYFGLSVNEFVISLSSKDVNVLMSNF